MPLSPIWTPILEPTVTPSGGVLKARHGQASSSTFEFKKNRFKQSRWYSVLADLLRAGNEPNLISHTVAMRSCAQSSLWRMASTLFAVAVAWDLEPDVISCGTIMGSCKRDWQRSVRFLAWAEDCHLQISSTLVGQAVSACKEALLWKMAGTLLEVAAGRAVLPDLMTYTAMLGTVADRWARSLSCMGEMGMLRLCVDQVSCNSAMNACARSGLWRRTLKMMRGSAEMDRSTLSTCQNACAKSLAWEVPLVLLGSATSWHIRCDVVAFTACLGALKTWPRSLELLQRLRETQLEPDLACFHASMDGSAWEMSLNLLGLLEETPGNTPTVTTYNVAINSCHDWRMARRLLHAARGLSPSMGLEINLIGYNSAMAKGPGPWEAPLQSLQEMIDLGLAPDAMSDASLRKAWRQQQQWRRALFFGDGDRSKARAKMSAFSKGSEAGASLYQSSSSQGSPWYLALSLWEVLRQRRLAAGSPPVNRWEQVLDVFGAKDAALAANSLAASSPWRWVLEIFETSLQQRFSGSEEIHRKALSSCQGSKLSWVAGLQLFEDLGKLYVVEEKMNGVLCDLQRTAGSGWHTAFETLQQIQCTRCRVDVLHCSSLLRVCASSEGWSQALSLLATTRRQRVQMDEVAWNAMLSATKVTAADFGSSADLIAGAEAPGASALWATALSLKGCMRWEDLYPDVITYNTLLSASTGRWEDILRLLVDMEGTRMDLEDVAALTVIDACAHAGQLAVGRQLITGSMLKNVPAVVRLWSMATLGVSDPREIAGALLEANGQRRPSWSPDEVCKFWWAASMLGIHCEKLVQELQELCTPGFLRRFQLDELVAVAMAAEADGSAKFFSDLQGEVLQRLRHAVDDEFRSAGTIRKVLQDILGIIWAMNFALGELRPTLPPEVAPSLLRLAACLDHLATEPSRARSRDSQVQWLGGDNTAGATTALAMPTVSLETQELLVLEKPPGWEVYGDTRHQLLSYVLDRKLLGGVSNAIHGDVHHAHGFLHRLDVPSSGLIVCAKSYSSYYNLQLQLVSGAISRDYVVLCHGYVPFGRQEITARLNCLLETTKAGGQGKPSRTFIKPAAYVHRTSVTSLTLLLVRIDTGRRHQIRSHLAFLQHATVSDSRYSSAETFAGDLGFCRRNFIHRFQLGSKEFGLQQVVTMVLPEDLKVGLEV